MRRPTSLNEASRTFRSSRNCRDYLISRRWPQGITCPHCGSNAVYVDATRDGWECATRHPKRKFTLKTGTLFEDSPLGLDKWLVLIWMVANTAGGLTTLDVAHKLGVTQKTAWSMLQRIKLALQEEADAHPAPLAPTRQGSLPD